MTPFISPLDTHNQALLAAVHPSDWTQPVPIGVYDFVVIGAGTAGLVAAAGAAGLGARVALVERHLMGGDCLNTGCVPSKALLRSASAAADASSFLSLGINLPSGFNVDFPAVMERLRRLRAEIAPHDSAQRFRQLGIDVFFGQARFIAKDALDIDGSKIHFRRAVIATGARPELPQVPGLVQSQPLTHQTLFNLTECPKHLVVLGGGPVGCELAQAFRRLGSQVTLIHNKSRLLDREDPDASALVQASLVKEGVALQLETSLEKVESIDTSKRLHLRSTKGIQHLTATTLLVATGRVPNVEHLNLETAGVELDPKKGIFVDDFLRTTNPHIYASGDVCLPWKFTHAADFASRIVIQNALFALGPIGRRRLSSLNMSWCTYTDPEVAHTGLTLHDAQDRGIQLDTYTQPFNRVDRALLESSSEGFARIHTRRGTGFILGATVVGKNAGELINEISVAMAGKISLGTLAAVIHPYPTHSEALRKLGDQYNRTRLTPRTVSLLKRLLALRR